MAEATGDGAGRHHQALAFLLRPLLLRPLGQCVGLSLWADEAQLPASLGISQLFLLVTQPGLGLLGSQDEMDQARMKWTTCWRALTEAHPSARANALFTPELP